MGSLVIFSMQYISKQAIRDRRVGSVQYCVVLCLSSLRDSAEKRPRCRIRYAGTEILHREPLRHIRTTNSAIIFHLLSSISDSISILSIISTMSVSNSCCYYCLCISYALSYRYLTSMRYLPPYYSLVFR